MSTAGPQQKLVVVHVLQHRDVVVVERPENTNMTTTTISSYVLLS